ncbi:hypothetical protein THTE_0157 [Thermogutta terrifontis]|uniref:Uncharacterized protein n=1 Tax=Thermogutta terrifontis TaxID=1331910 RepID=A0A286R9X4_9BACT|nr:hypothetical protein THTE_0157 [Thermogutta terrifontis]
MASLYRLHGETVCRYRYRRHRREVLEKFDKIRCMRISQSMESLMAQ